MNHKFSYFKKENIDFSARIVLIVFLISFLSWEVYEHIMVRNWISTHHSFSRVSSDLDLINPSVVQNQIPDIAQNVTKEVSDYMDKYSSFKKVDSFGMYVRDLDSGYGFGINENEKFIPASLLKVMTMIAYYKASELNPKVLENTYVFQGTDYNVGQTFRPVSEMEEGKSYTVDELIDRSIKYSDNNASEILINNLNEDFYKKVFVDIGVEYPKSNTDKTMTPKVYSNVFRVLYNSTFLNPEKSQKALRNLNLSEFNGGIQAGINGYVNLSNKFGERVVEENGVRNIYLHDCGIVYAKHPYVLCMMSKGRSALDLEEFMREISKIVYDKMKY